MSDRVERLLTDAFAGHEQDVPVAAALRPAIAAGARRRRARRRWTYSGAAAVIVALITSLPLTLPSALALVRPDRAPATDADALLDAGAPAGQNFLVLGIDRRSQSPGDTVRADAILLLHVDPGTRTAYQLSIPRDLLVEVPGFGRQQANNAFVFGGYDLTSRVVSKLLGARIDGGAVVDFSGMQRVTDAVGGVDLCVDQRTVSMHLGYDPSGRAGALRSGMQPVVYEPGCRHFAGWQALDYVRQRQSLPGDADDRDTHLRQFLRQFFVAFAQQLTDPVKVAKVMQVAGGALEAHLGAASVSDLAAMIGRYDAHQVTGLKLPIGQDRTVLPDGDGLFAALRGGTVPAWIAAHPQYVG